MRIQKLSTNLINQIAAGEVVERPASVVKELLENSLDAQSKNIRVEIEKGGGQLIRVSDDGIGICKQDLPLAVSSFATSKISHLNDINTIQTLGFRGEALASISAISRFSLSSKVVEQDHAWVIKLAGHDDPFQLQPSAYQQGCQIEVHDLFFNTPVRKKFLRAARTEFEHIDTVVKRLALSHFDVGIALRHEQKTLFDLAPAKNDSQREQRVARIFTQEFMRQSVFIDRTASDLHLWGWIGLPEFMRSQNDLQYFYVNGRIIRDKVVRHAIAQAYQDLLYPGRQAAYVLHLEVDPMDLDVNVHPMKQEVRFRQARLIHDFLFDGVSKALNKENKQISPAFEHNDLFRNKMQLDEKAKINAQYGDIQKGSTVENVYPLGEVITQINEQYVLTRCEQGLVLFDSNAALLHITYNRLKGEDIQSRPLLVPLNLNYHQDELDLFQKYAGDLQHLGLSLDQIGESSIVIREIPRCLVYADLKKLLTDILQYLKPIAPLAFSESHECELRLIVAKNNLPQQKLQAQEMNQLLRDIEQLNMPKKNKLGQVIYKIFSIAQMQTLLNG